MQEKIPNILTKVADITTWIARKRGAIEAFFRTPYICLRPDTSALLPVKSNVAYLHLAYA